MAFLGAPQAIFLRNEEQKWPFPFGKTVGGRGEFHSELHPATSAAFLRCSCILMLSCLSSLCWPLSAQAAELASSQHCCCAFGK